MQRYCTELTERLLKSLDKEYNVVDMGAVVDVITALEKTTITKEVLEVTRLGKHINELRRKTNNDALAKRAKDLVRRWRDMVLPPSHPTLQPTPADTAPQALNGTKPQSPALRGLKPHSPAAIRALIPHSPAFKASLKPHSPLLRDTTNLKQVLSPALSLHSDRSRSPNLPSTKQHSQHQGSLSSHIASTTTTTSTTNNRLNADVTSKLGLTSTHNHTFDAVPRTHSSNKRLRKDDSSGTNSPITPPLTSSLTTGPANRSSQLASSTNDTGVSSRFEPPIKRARINGETSNYSNFSFTAEQSNNNVISTCRGTTNSGVNFSAAPNQKVPSPRDADKTNDRLSDVASRNVVDNARETIIADTAAISQATTGPKKRGRKKGSKSTKNQTLPEDRVKEKLASISRNPKLKTTQELLADLQARGSTTGTNFATGSTTTGSSEITTGTTTTSTRATSHTTATTAATSGNTEAPRSEDILRNAKNDERSLSSWVNRAKREKSNLIGEDNRKKRDSKNFASKHWENARRSDDEEEDEDEDDSERDEPYVDVGKTKELTVEEILAKLPPLDRDAISWSDSENYGRNENCEIADEGDVYDRENDEPKKKKKEITEKDVERLHIECVEGLNGNFQSKIRDTSNEDAPIVAGDDNGIIDELVSKCVYRRLEGKENDREFREWHEMLARPSYEGQTLHILPYVIID